ncbi:MAG: hypothetical protein WCG23_11540 [bacterium]
MFSNVVNLINSAFQPPTTQKIQAVPRPVVLENPFAAPFINTQSKRQISYGKNNPVIGGYFAGYYNGKQNIVGRKLFVNV